mmetsp:Transcript_1873/g.6709  ORF Transcript_1873/g.6709 Transcript_1873/m.6709 type:complete len:303 (+) Transcript_1873:139-1047(+)
MVLGQAVALDTRFPIASRGYRCLGASLRTGRGRTPTARPRTKLLVRAAKNFDADEVMKRIENVELGQLTDQAGVPVSQGLVGVDGQKIGEQSDSLELAWDPDNLLGDVEEEDKDLIGQRLKVREEELAEKKRKEEEKKREEDRLALAKFREERWAAYPRGNADGMIQYLLETEENEMEFELTRMKPDLDEAFFTGLRAYLEGMEDGPEKERVQALENVTREFADYIEKVSQAMASPAERLRALLKSPNKKQHIREMAINKEIDTNLLALLQANVDGAQKAGEEEIASFMLSILNEMKKFAKV